jgi:hypothetical protein
MKRNGVFATTALVVSATIGLVIADTSPSGLTDIQLANVEALSQGETGDRSRLRCYGDLKYELGSSTIECEYCRIMADRAPRYDFLYQFCDEL